MDPEANQKKNLPEYGDELPVGEIVKALKGIRYGYVQIVVQDSRVIQIERTEKTRLDRQHLAPPSLTNQED